MLLRSASTPILKYPQSLNGFDGAGSLFLNRPVSMTASPIKKIERTASDSNLKLLIIPGRKNFCTSPMGAPVGVKEDGMGVFATTKEPTSGGGGDVGSGGFSTGGDGCGDWGRGKDSLEEYYQMMIETYPGDCVLLANYAKYLKEVQGDLLKAEEYCERAILVNGNGDSLSLYAELIWSNHKDAARAKAYFEQATKASPNDCHVHAAFARFLWDAGVEEEEEEDEEENEFQFPTLTAFPQTQFSHEHPVTAAS
ncbi:hypothetical protein SLE2022_035190 [Rubroshorea leprosula]